jgi:hypothetical protein
MKRILFFAIIIIIYIACNSGPAPATDAAMDTSKAAAPAAAPAAVTMPYTPIYVTLTDAVSDADLLTVLNSYKYWENGDMAAVKSTLSDSIFYHPWAAWEFNGTADSLLKMWTKSRDSLSSVKITMTAWRKQHSVEKNEDWVSVWYDEVDKYKIGKVDSASYQDDNLVVNGKVRVLSQHKQFLKKAK